MSIANRVLSFRPRTFFLPTYVSVSWPARFLKRHPEYYKIKQKPLAVERKNINKPETIQAFMERYKAANKRYSI
jgi:hypothetical protein